MQVKKHEHLLVAIEILKALELPLAQQTDLCGNVLLALCEIGPDSTWKSATNNWIRIHDIIHFLREKYNISYAENSRETIRKQALHHFRNAAIIEDNGKATNSPNYRYRLTAECCHLIRLKNSLEWSDGISSFKQAHISLIQQYSSKKEMQKYPVKINGQDYCFSPGEHNQLQKAIFEEFAPRFAPNSECLYVGDTIVKDLHKNDQKLKELGFSISVHDKMPDIILYCPDKQWIYFIEAVTSVGPMNPKRVIEINQMTQNVQAGKIFVTAFLNLQTYKEFISQIAWETEVWISDVPDHLIHLNGDKFLGPR